ncbi:MAG: hypothetical protein K0R03_2169 [Moraxellaceae bacterium]|jgi:hypothetical protein|nr:hypothetical protein [Moraxellaceae bacterium]
MANDDYDELDETADPVDEEVEEEAEEGSEEEVSAEAGSDTPAPKPVDLEDAETLTVSSKEALRRQLEEEMARFLAQGGQIKEIPPDVTADPPQKPVSNYGSKPI